MLTPFPGSGLRTYIEVPRYQVFTCTLTETLPFRVGRIMEKCPRTVGCDHSTLLHLLIMYLCQVYVPPSLDQAPSPGLHGVSSARAHDRSFGFAIDLFLVQARAPTGPLFLLCLVLLVQHPVLLRAFSSKCAICRPKWATIHSAGAEGPGTVVMEFNRYTPSSTSVLTHPHDLITSRNMNHPLPHMPIRTPRVSLRAPLWKASVPCCLGRLSSLRNMGPCFPYRRRAHLDRQTLPICGLFQ
jgi:hypothetical protein